MYQVYAIFVYTKPTDMPRWITPKLTITFPIETRELTDMIVNHLPDAWRLYDDHGLDEYDFAAFQNFATSTPRQKSKLLRVLAEAKAREMVEFQWDDLKNEIDWS